MLGVRPRFTAWCGREGHVALPAHPLTVAAYLHEAAATVTQAGERAYSPSTLARWVAGIGYHHRRAGHPAPGADELVTATLSGIRRDYAAAGERPRSPRVPLLTADIVTIVETMRADSAGWAAEVLERRDSAIFLVGFAGAFRRSELVTLTCSDISLHRLDGLHIKLRKSKTDQEGRGSIRALPFTHSHASCPPC
ncbi:integrase, partial [Rhodococcus sp. Rp3]|nr:integrase [Rhodococcus sp. Rp3]